MKKIIVLALMILLSGNLMANANTKAGAKAYNYANEGSASENPNTDGGFDADIEDVALKGDVYDYVQISLGFNEDAAIPVGTKLAVGRGVGTAGTVDLDNLFVQATNMAGTVTEWDLEGDNETVSGSLTVLGSSGNAILVKYNILVKKARKTVGTDPAVEKNIRITGTALIDGNDP